METTILLIIGMLSFLVCGTVASGKNRSFVGWGTLGFFTPLIGLIVAYSLENRALPLRSAPVARVSKAGE